jgi:hypothetical protein
MWEALPHLWSIAGAIGTGGAALAWKVAAPALKAQRDAIVEMDCTLTETAPFWANPISHDEARTNASALDPIRTASARVRSCGSRLDATTRAVWFNPLFALTRQLPPAADAREAARLVIGLSNFFVMPHMHPTPDGLFPGDYNRQTVATVRRLLRLS